MSEITTVLPSSESPKIPRHRSPNYPSMSLKSAIEKADLLYKGGAINPLMKVSILKLLGFEKFHGEAGRVLSALKSFGLIVEEANEKMRLSPRAVDIAARVPTDQRRIEAVRQAATAPPIYKELLDEYKGQLPPDSALKSELIAAKHFNPNSVDGFIADLRESLTLADLTPESRVEFEGDDEPNGKQDTQVKPKVGDHVQWVSGGQLIFREPKRVRDISADGQWAFVEGSNTGMPITELTIEKAPPETSPNAPVKAELKLTPPISIEQRQLLNQELVISIPRKFRVNVDVRGDELKKDDLARIKSQFTRWIEGLEEAFD